MEENKIKAQFFAQYLGQKFIVKDRLERKDRGIHILEDFTLDAVNIGGLIFDDSIKMDIVIDACTLLLRDISQLTDDELCFVAKLCGYIKGDFVDMGRSSIELFLEDYHLSIMAYQYLLCIGILLPFTFLNSDNQPITLQPTDIIAKGWVVIKTEE